MTLTDLVIGSLVLVSLVLLGVSVRSKWVARFRAWLAAMVAIGAAYLLGRIQPGEKDDAELPTPDDNRDRLDTPAIPNPDVHRVDVDRARDDDPEPGGSSGRIDRWQDISRE